jgi:hypothetical protein
MRANINDEEVTLGAVYGPNNNDMGFFRDLELNLMGSNNIILGGDFNCTYDPRPNLENLDTLNMVNIPSKVRSEALNEMTLNLKLFDPYRYLHPIERDFTYVPNAHRNINRSRIDFFLCSEGLGSIIKECWIEPSVVSSLFDHKMIRLSTTCPEKKVNRSVIKDCILNNRLTILAAQLCIKETHLIHANSDIMPRGERRNLLEHVGLGYFYLSEITKMEKNFCTEKNLTEKRLIQGRLEAAYDDLGACVETLPDLDYLNNMEKECDDVLFFETLVNNLKNMTLKIQDSIYKAKILRKKNLSIELGELKKNYKENMKMIFQKEKELSILMKMN